MTDRWTDSARSRFRRCLRHRGGTEIHAWRHPAFRERLKEQNLDRSDPSEGRDGAPLRHQGTAKCRRDMASIRIPTSSSRSRARAGHFESSRIRTTSSAGSTRPRLQATLDGTQDKAIWFMFTLESMMQAGWRYGVDGQRRERYANMANGGRCSSTSRTARSSA